MNDLVETKSNMSMRVAWTPEQISLIKDTVCKGASDDELKLFLYVAQKTGLDPLTKQIYSIARWDSKLGREVRTNQTSIDGYRVVAERSGSYAGQLGPFFCGKDGIWKDIWLEDGPPIAAKVGVLRSDFKEPLYSVAMFESYVQKFYDKKTGKWETGQFWKKFPELMIAKVAEALALRKAFPQDLSGIFTKEEMDQANSEEQPLIENKETKRNTIKEDIKEMQKDITKDATQKAKEDLENLKIRKSTEELKKNSVKKDEIIDVEIVDSKAEELQSREKTKDEIKDNIKAMLTTLTFNLKTIQEKGAFMINTIGCGKWSEVEKMGVDHLLNIEAILLKEIKK